MRMKPKNRYEWLIQYMKERGVYDGETFDVMNKSFVEDYVQATGAKSVLTLVGSDKCRQLGKDLAVMHKNGNLFRRTEGTEGTSGYGFPKWFYQYWIHREKIC